MKHFSPGRYSNVPAEEYRDSFGMSRTTLCKFAQAPAIMEMESGESADKKRELLIGIALHIGILQPELYSEIVVKGPDNRRGNQWDEFLKVNEGNIVLLEKEYQMVADMGMSFYNHPIISPIFLTKRKGQEEVSYYWKEAFTDLSCRCRPDFVALNGCVYDIKTCAAGRANDAEFLREVINFKYHVQAAFYLDGMNAIDGTEEEPEPHKFFFFIAIEKAPPYLVKIHEISLGSRFYSLGKQWYVKQLRRYQRYLEAQKMEQENGIEIHRGYPLTINKLEPPVWLEREFENE